MTLLSCPKCQTDNAPRTKYCISCNANLERPDEETFVDPNTYLQAIAHNTRILKNVAIYFLVCSLLAVAIGILSVVNR
jgi:hypothetical protein